MVAGDVEIFFPDATSRFLRPARYSSASVAGTTSFSLRPGLVNRDRPMNHEPLRQPVKA